MSFRLDRVTRTAVGMMTPGALGRLLRDQQVFVHAVGEGSSHALAAPKPPAWPDWRHLV